MNYWKQFLKWVKEESGIETPLFHLTWEILSVVVILLFVGLVLLTRFLAGW
jgi:hypothetical protein